MYDRRSPTSRLHEQLGQLIAETDPGGRLPSEPDLARQMGVSRATLREAMRTFETQGLIRRHQGVGTFVVRPSRVLESGLEVLESIETLAQRIGLQLTTGKIQVDIRPVESQEASALGLTHEDQVTSVERVILAEDRPVAFLIDVLPVDLISREVINEDFSGSVLDLLLKRGDLPLINSHCEIAAVAASGPIARALNIQRGDALLRFVSKLFTLDGRVVDYSHSYFLPGYFRFHVVRALA
jgi:GntR family transcriptional regulator